PGTHASTMRWPTSPSLPAVVAKRAAVVLALVLAIAVCRARGVEGARVPRLPMDMSSGGGNNAGVEMRWQAGGGASPEDEDYGYVDPPPDTNRRGAGAPIPHKHN
uniref:Uncharacterized protein n=2 Tax=Aegilops tauschii subsp. strangulata TaxID=200361 RepID=A0A453LMN5_AEGTS